MWWGACLAYTLGSVLSTAASPTIPADASTPAIPTLRRLGGRGQGPGVQGCLGYLRFCLKKPKPNPTKTQPHSSTEVEATPWAGWPHLPGSVGDPGKAQRPSSCLERQTDAGSTCLQTAEMKIRFKAGSVTLEHQQHEKAISHGLWVTSGHTADANTKSAGPCGGPFLYSLEKPVLTLARDSGGGSLPGLRLPCFQVLGTQVPSLHFSPSQATRDTAKLSVQSWSWNQKS